MRPCFFADAIDMRGISKRASVTGVTCILAAVLMLDVSAGVTRGSDFSLTAEPGEALASIEEAGPGGGGGSPAAGLTVLTEAGRAGLSRYSASEEAGIPEKGAMAIEYGFAISHRNKSDHSFARYDGSPQFTYGLFDGVEIALYGAYSHESSRDRNGTQFDAVGLQVLMGLIDPSDHPVGFSFYQSIEVGDETLSLDTRLVFGIDRGPWNFTYNLGLHHDLGGTSWFGTEGPSVETAVTLGHSFGVSRSFECDKLIHELSLGLELTADSTWLDYKNYESTTCYLGPTLGITFAERWALTVSAFIQLTDEEETPRWVVVSSLSYSF